MNFPGKARQSFIALFSIPLMIASAHALDVTIDYATVVRTLSPYFHGINYCAYWDDLQGSAGSANAFRQSGIQTIRFPGGWPALSYPFDNPYATVAVGGGNSASKTSLFQLRDYALTSKTQILYQTNPAESVQRIARLADTCKNNNIPVALWEIGNESDCAVYNSDAGKTQYCQYFNAQATAIKAVFPNTIIMGPSLLFFNDSSWMSTFLTQCGSKADAISIHHYPGGGWTDTAMMSEAYKWQNSWWPSFDKLNTLHKPVYITELSADKHPDWYHVGLKLFMSVAHADLIGALAKTGVAGYSLFGTLHGITDSWGILAGNGGGDAWVNGTLNPGTLPPETPSPDYFMLCLWSKMGNNVLNATHASDAKYVFNSWSHKKDNGSVEVMLINKDTALTQDVTVKFTGGFNPTGWQVDVYEMRKTKTYAWDRVDSVVYNNVVFPFPATANLPPPIPGGACTGPTYTRSVPAMSVTVLDFINPNARAINSGRSFRSSPGVRITGNTGSLVRIAGTANQPAGIVRIFDLSGKSVDRIDGKFGPLTWNAAARSPGVYFVKVGTAANSQTAAVPVSR